MAEHRAVYVLLFFWVDKEPIMIGPYTITAQTRLYSKDRIQLL